MTERSDALAELLPAFFESIRAGLRSQGKSQDCIEWVVTDMQGRLAALPDQFDLEQLTAEFLLQMSMLELELWDAKHPAG